MSQTPNEWTLEGFVEHFGFVHDKMPDHKFVWVLGAGASLASGIPLGSKLVDEWLKELHLKEDGSKAKLEEWATAENLGIKDFKYENRASFYPRIYERRFRNYPDEGFAYLESVMSRKDPSPGYSVLAAALAADPPRHNAVITTNFDNLVADALSIYTDTFPFVCGHESLTGFVRVAMRRPLICKIHRDLLLAPQNDHRSLTRLKDAWGIALCSLFQNYTPLFIGYGGNDDTLMDLLVSLQPGDIKGQLIWCYYEGGKPSERIVNMVADHKGVLVPVPDFDLLMVMLGEKMGIKLLDEEIGRRAKARTERYRNRIQQLDTVTHPAVTKALAATFDRSGGWWVWEQKARLETDPERREVVYRQGIQHYPKSAELNASFATFLWEVRSNYDEAERLFRTALELSPEHPFINRNLAVFLTEIRGHHDEAEQLYRKALKLDPQDSAIISNYASFLNKVRGNHDEAERLYNKALELDPQNPAIIYNFANFLSKVRGNHNEAERLYRKALEHDPQYQYPTISGNFAVFLTDVRGNHDEAERLYRKTCELDPKNANNIGNYSEFLLGRGRLDEAGDQLTLARSLNGGKKNQLANALALLQAIHSGVCQQDDMPALEELRALLSASVERGTWNFNHVLAFARDRVSSQDHVLYSAFAEAILDPEKIHDAEAHFKQRVVPGRVSNDGNGSMLKPADGIPIGKATKKRSLSKNPSR